MTKGNTLHPLNDLCKIKLDTDKFGFGGKSKTTAESGILVALPEAMPYFGFWSFAFDNSLANTEVTSALKEHYSQLIGQRVYWTALSEKGNIIEEADGTRYAYIKLTSLIAVGDADSQARNVHSDGAGSFNVATD